MSLKDDKKRRQLIIGIIIAIYVIIFVFVFLAFLDVIVIDDLITNIILYIAIGLALVGLSIWGIIYLKAKQKEKLKKEQQDAAKRQNTSPTRLQANPSTRVPTRTQKVSHGKINIDTLLYTGATSGQICGICKLSFREDQAICTCPYCESLFHKNHLEEWLVDYNDCPVCNRNLSDYITKE